MYIKQMIMYQLLNIKIVWLDLTLILSIKTMR